MQSLSTVLVTGGSGCVGSGVVRALLRHGHHVLALSRSERTSEFLQSLGAEPVPGDLNNLNWLSSVARSDAIIHCGMDWNAGPEAEKRVLEWFLSHSTGKRFLYTGGTWLFGSGEFTETSKTMERGHGWDWLIDGAESVLANPDVAAGIVVHPPLVYDLDLESGKCTGWLHRMMDDLRLRGKIRVVGSEERRQAIGHTDDVGEVFALALEKGEARCSYNASVVCASSGQMAEAAFALFSGKELQCNHAPGYAFLTEDVSVDKEGAKKSIIEEAPVKEQVKELGSIKQYIEVLDLESARLAFGASANGMNLDQCMRSPASLALGWSPKYTSLPSLGPAGGRRLHESSQASSFEN